MRRQRYSSVPYSRLFGWIHVLGWLLLWLTALLSYVQRGTYPIWQPKNFWGLFIIYLSGYGVSVLVLILNRRRPVEGATLGRMALRVLLGVVAGTLFWIWLDHFLSSLIFYGRLGAIAVASYSYISMVLMRFPLLFAFSALDVAFRLWRAWEAQRHQADEARHLAQHAQLTMLRYQLNPHFFFNALNTIRALIDENRVDARAMVTELSEFLRYSLGRGNTGEAPLAEEMEAIGHYLAVEKKRFEEKLEIQLKVEPEAGAWPVLSLLLHPLVENAIKHGMATSPLPLKVEILAKITGGRLEIKVGNTGQWKPPTQSSNSDGTGTGLANLQDRLNNAYAGRHAFHIGPEDDRVVAQLTLYPQSEKFS